MKWSLPRHCQAVVVHDDLATKQRAGELWSAIVNNMGQDVPCAVTYMSAEQVEREPVMERAGQIDIVIVSMRDLARFMANIAGWLSDWLTADTCLPRALFVLHEGDEDRQLVDFLRTLAEFAGVTMFSCGREANRVQKASRSERGRCFERLMVSMP